MQKLRLPQYIGYGAGDMANNLSFTMVATALALYYTDVVGTGQNPKHVAASIATLVFVVRFWDAFCDIFAGSLVDRTQTRFGKFRPFFLFGAVPLLFASMMCFSVPMHISWDMKLVWAYVSYAAMGLLYSLVNIPYGSLAAAMTQDVRERSKLASYRVVGASLGSLAINFLVMPQIQKFKGNPSGLQHALTMCTLAFLVLGTLLYVVLFFTAKEQVPREQEKVSMKESLPILFRNRPLMMLCLSSLIFLSSTYVTSTLTVYYARDVLGNAKFAIPMALVGILGTIVLAILAPQIVRRIGKRNLYMFSGGLAVIGSLMVWLLPTPDLSPLRTNPKWTPELSQVWLPIVAWFILQVGIGTINTVVWALEADTVEYGEWKSHIRTEGVTYAMFSFTRKMGQAIGGWIGLTMLGWFLYDGDLKTGQSAETIKGIKMGIGLIPAVIFAIATAIMFFYPLTEKKFQEILGDLEQRRVDLADEAKLRTGAAEAIDSL